MQPAPQPKVNSAGDSSTADNYWKGQLDQVSDVPTPVTSAAAAGQVKPLLDRVAQLASVAGQRLAAAQSGDVAAAKALAQAQSALKSAASAATADAMTLWFTNANLTIASAIADASQGQFAAAADHSQTSIIARQNRATAMTAQSAAAAESAQANLVLHGAQAKLTLAKKAAAAAHVALVKAQKDSVALSILSARYRKLYVQLSPTQRAYDSAAVAVATRYALQWSSIQSALGLSVTGPSIDSLTVTQTTIARQIAQVALARGLGYRGVLVGEMAGLTEAGLSNPNHGDGPGPSSRGTFQQMPSWGSLADRMNPTTAAELFFDRMARIPNWQNLDPWVLAQEVQGSEFVAGYTGHGSDGTPGWNYLQQLPAAQRIVSALVTSPTPPALYNADFLTRAIDGFASNSGVSPQAQIAVSFALAQIGKAYVYAGDGPKAFDCSGLTTAAWAQAGITIPRVSYEQATLPTVPLAQLQPGDLVTYYSPTSHVAIYVGNGMVVSAADEALGIIYVPVAKAGPNPVGHRVLSSVTPIG